VIGDRVFLDTLNISMTHPTKKFTYHYLGPFLAVHPVSLHTYHLKLSRFLSCLYPVFHVVKLMPAPLDPIEGRRACPPPPSEIVGGEARYEVEEVRNSRMRGRRLQYLVRWKGYGHKENLWLSEGDLNAPDLIVDFHKGHLTAPKQINALMFGCMGFRPQPCT
jgi:hypothetical protein